MDIQSDKYKSGITRRDPFSVVLYTVLGIVKKLIGFFTLTEEDRIAAGIYVGEGRERDK